MTCICDALGQNIGSFEIRKLLQGQRFIIGWICSRCSVNRLSIQLPKQDRGICPTCNSNSKGTIQHIICPEHGCRGPETIWVTHRMREPVISVVERSVGYYVEKLKKREPFSHARFGDGDWLTIFGYDKLHNSNGCTFTKELGRAVRQALKNGHEDDHVLLSHPHYRFGLHIQEFLEREGIGIKWVKEFVLNTMLEGRLFPLFEQMREYRVLYVGPHMIDLLGFFPLRVHFKPPPTNSYEHRQAIMDGIFEAVERQKIDLIAWSCGGAAKVFIDEVFKRTAGEITQIDFGCSFDGFFPPLSHVNQAGSRGFIRKGGYNWDELLRLNTGNI